jgi:small subunit ribosomal protein S14
MAGIFLKKKNNKYRFNKDRNYLKTVITSYFIKDRYLPKKISLSNLNKKHNFKNSSISKIKNKCLISGRNRSVLKKFRLSRMFLKNLGVAGYINGLKKSSW